MVTKHQADQLIWSGIQQPDDSFRKLFIQKGADEKVVDDLQRYLFEVHGPIVGYIYTETDECQLLTGRAQAYFKKYPDKLSRLLDMSREFMADGCIAFPIVEDTIDLFDIESVSLKKSEQGERTNACSTIPPSDAHSELHRRSVPCRWSNKRIPQCQR